ncbi:RimK family alpha-L-glutamate ligase [Hyphomonas sp.]|uniref:ATP-grasp domain-containing protein n=1 Tax=Hyphomonas sp. TaxID=87 RepID=UPI00391B846E
MTKIAYLASRVTLPGSLVRRTDAFEHDLMMDALRGPFAARGLTLEDLSWDDPKADWASYGAVIIGTTWDYWDRLDEFLAALRRIESQTRLFNPVALVEWNIRKTYLRELEAKGARLIPTVWMDVADEASARAAFDTLGAEDVVFKRQVGAGAKGQHRLRRGEAIPEMPHAMMAQPFLPMIQTEGELSFIFIDGDFSHALVKRAQPGDYRIQSTYGGREEKIAPSADDLAAARAIIAALDEAPLYGRVDMLRGADGGLLLMELEVLEPYLYPVEGPELGERMAAGVARRLAL